MHPRQAIREAVVAAITGLNTTGANVSANRLNPYFTLPSLNVTTLDESVDAGGGSMNGEADQIRELRLVIEGRAKASDTPDDQLDTMTDEVENAILNSATVKALAYDCTLQSTAFSFDGENANPIGKVEMTFSFLYQA
jgi:hypothetical protein